MDQDLFDQFSNGGKAQATPPKEPEKAPVKMVAKEKNRTPLKLRKGVVFYIVGAILFAAAAVFLVFAPAKTPKEVATLPAPAEASKPVEQPQEAEKPVPVVAQKQESAPAPVVAAPAQPVQEKHQVVIAPPAAKAAEKAKPMTADERELAEMRKALKGL